MTITVGSLCSGYGGLDLGLELGLGQAVRHAWHVEYDKHPSAILAHRFGGVPNYGDVKTAPYDDMERVDWLTAGYPCQPFSHAGNRKGSDDPRHLWPGVRDALGRLRPRNVLLENVRGHLSLGLADVLADLSGLGYDTRWGVVRAADAGAPHGRARVFIVARDTVGTEHPHRPLAGVPGGTGTEPGGVGRDDGDTPPADTGGQRHGQGVHPRAVGRLDSPDAGQARERQRSRSVVGDRSATAPADTDNAGRGEHRRPLAVVAEHGATERDGGVDWGAYAPAIHRWERITGRPAPPAN